MKSRLSRLLDVALYGALFAMVALLVSRKCSGPREGAPAADFDLPIVGDPTGARFRLADHRGKAVLLEVFAGWCGACKRSAPAVVEAFRNASPDRVAFVGVSVDDSPEAALQTKRAWDIPYPIVHDDGHVSKTYEIRVLPTFVLIDATGTIRHVSTGKASRADIEDWLSEL
ncbi:MAG: TlpA disulfide reductase family protein [Pseudomonadota bacterium]